MNCALNNGFPRKANPEMEKHLQDDNYLRRRVDMELVAVKANRSYALGQSESCELHR
jgi:hypothetical protein